MSDKTPVPKVAAATVAAAVATVVVIALQTLTGTEVPVGLEGALATIFAFIAGYLAPRDPAMPSDPYADGRVAPDE